MTGSPAWKAATRPLQTSSYAGHRHGAGLLSDREFPCLTLRSGTYRARARLRSPVVRPSEFVASACVDSIAPFMGGSGHSAYIPDLGSCAVTACTLQGMARVRSGQAPAWPLVSGRSVRSGSRVKRDFPCTLTGALPPALVVLRAQSRLRLEGRARTLSGPSPDPSPARTLAPSGVRGRGSGGHRQIRVRAVVNAVTGTPRASLLKTVAALPRRRSARPSLPR